MKKTLHSLLPAVAVIAMTAVASTGYPTAASASHVPRQHNSSSNQDSASVGPDYYSSNDNPFHAD